VTWLWCLNLSLGSNLNILGQIILDNSSHIYISIDLHSLPKSGYIIIFNASHLNSSILGKVTILSSKNNCEYITGEPEVSESALIVSLKTTSVCAPNSPETTLIIIIVVVVFGITVIIGIVIWFVKKSHFKNEILKMKIQISSS
jgi:hypothetical protein